MTMPDGTSVADGRVLAHICKHFDVSTANSIRTRAEEARTKLTSEDWPYELSPLTQHVDSVDGALTYIFHEHFQEFIPNGTHLHIPRRYRHELPELPLNQSIPGLNET